ncbi:MAG: hypothetical protein ACRDSN_13690 [Pseudonocardiaceae bacterium]
MTNGIIITVTAIFVINFVAQFVIPGYRPDPAVYGIFMGIVGGAFALRGKGRDGKDAS